ncbi:uncharacterized protein LOC495478 precursor [Xenopus laevis]|uniref:LOC495478 protein n=1 Tax=Xenopus laevis TaxID=8355 RepID=Q5U4K4_XENLA|nr:uncharacterized protein LOC495478 precursor [Xenopus laevis]AAH85061.1 LOC495478 protein [Xenopus laevis]
MNQFYQFYFLWIVLVASQGGHVESVDNYLYGTVELPCEFPFVTGPQDLVMTWLKVVQDSENVVVHSYRDGQDITEHQDSRYKGRTRRSRGKLNLILTNVTFDDEGTYICQAANQKSRGSKEVRLSITSINAEDPTVSMVYTDGGDQLKCWSSGNYRNPQVEWHDREKKDLSGYGKLNITDIGNGRKMVESVLEYNIEPQQHYFCHVKEGRLKRSARAVVSDETVSVNDEL